MPQQYLTAHDCCLKARTTLNQWYAWVRLGDAPKAAMRGWWHPKDLEAWVADRQAGKPLPASGKRPRAWRQDALAQIATYDREAVKRLCRVRSDGYLNRLVARGDIPKSIAPDRWKQSEIDGWVADRQQGRPLPWSNSILPAWDLERGEYYCITELPKLLGVSASTIGVYERRGDFPQRMPLPRKGKFPKFAVDAWLEDRKAGRALPSGHFPTQWDPLGPMGHNPPGKQGLKQYHQRNTRQASQDNQANRPQSAAYFDALPIDQWVKEIEATRLLLAQQEWAVCHSSLTLQEFQATYVIPVNKIREHYGEKRAAEYMSHLATIANEQPTSTEVEGYDPAFNPTADFDPETDGETSPYPEPHQDERNAPVNFEVTPKRTYTQTHIETEDFGLD